MAKTVLRIGIAGLGTVGGGLLNLLAERPDFAPAGATVAVTGVSARERARARATDISNLPWWDDAVALAASPDNDVFVELIGGSEGVAKAAVETALRARQAGGHRQQGADRRSWRRAGRARRSQQHARSCSRRR